jgi:hypothetical protein
MQANAQKPRHNIGYTLNVEDLALCPEAERR